ncbi:MAG: flagellar biosynthesis protein FliQ [Fimbriimonas ginsengisoli]|uniref:Flagellar biosynthetic protein FliQ n=1 Tax=Fimbriimonas ginsengisoli TaxID=1005039 RepID=A0A931LSU3_FIMGI|nr:flagellar biosynthesis protein FliQ [Fimbriimonas ginsengisoli]
MDQGIPLELARQGIQVALMVSLPVLAVTLFLGVLVSVFQAITSVQEMTLSFVPKLIGVGLVLTFFGGWMLTTLVGFAHACLDQAARVGQ